MPDVNAPMMVIRKRLSATEGAPADTRVNPETGEVETSVDGVNWNPNPGADPRLNPAYLLPPTTEGNCAAAAGMIAEMKKYIAIVGAGGTVGGLATAILAGVVVLLPVSWLFVAFLGIAGSFVLAGSLAVALSFTEEVWDDLLCILYCNMSEDGQVSAAQLENIKSEIAALGIANVTLGTNLIFQSWGHVGLSNAGVVSADPEADCSECDCVEGWCYEFDFTESAHGFTGIFGGSWVSGVGFTSANDSVYATRTFGFFFDCHEVTVYIANPGVLSLPNTSRRICINDTGVTCTPNNATLDPEGGAWYKVVGGFNMNRLSFGQERSNDDTSFLTSITKIRFSNTTGENPFGADNCEDE